MELGNKLYVLYKYVTKATLEGDILHAAVEWPGLPVALHSISFLDSSRRASEPSIAP